MRKYMLTGVVAALMLAVIAGSSSARTFELSSQTFRSTWARLTFEGAELSNTCNLTMEGSFHARNLAKSLNSLIGYVTSAVLRECQNPTTVLGLPWHITYGGFTGTLPNIGTIRINLIGAAFLIDFGFLGRCLYRSTAAEPSRGIITLGAGGVVTGIASDGTASVPLFLRLGGLACPARGFLKGETNSVTVLNSATRITVRLI